VLIPPPPYRLYNPTKLLSFKCHFIDPVAERKYVNIPK